MPTTRTTPTTRTRFTALVAGPPWRIALLLGLLAALVGLVKYGLVMWSGWHYLHEIAVNWSHPRTGPLVVPPQDGILANGAVSFITGAAGLSSLWPYVTFQVIFTVLAILLPFMMPSIRNAPRSARLLFIVMAGGPILPLLLLTIGGYDTLFVAACAVAVLARSRLIGALGWLVLSFQHTSLGAFALIAWLVFEFAGRTRAQAPDRLARAGFAVVAVVLGIVANTAMVQALGGVTSRLELYLRYPFSYYVGGMIADFPLTLFGALGVTWLVLLDRRFRSTRPARTLLIMGVVATVVMPLVAEDQTRIIALVLYPAVLAWVRSTTEATAETTAEPASGPRPESSTDLALDSAWRRYAIASAIVPVPIVQAGKIMTFGWETILHWRATFL